MAFKTKVEIMETFENILRKKNIDEITVKDITDGCGLNRKTFYYYFSDIDNLINSTFNYEVEYFSEKIDKNISESDAIVAFFDMVQRNKNIIYHIYNYSGYERLVDFLDGTIFKIIRGASEKYKSSYNVTDKQLDLASEAFTSIISGFIIKWVDEGMETNIKELVNEVYSLLNGIMSHMISNAEKANIEKNK